MIALVVLFLGGHWPCPLKSAHEVHPETWRNIWKNMEKPNQPINTINPSNSIGELLKLRSLDGGFWNCTMQVVEDILRIVGSILLPGDVERLTQRLIEIAENGFSNNVHRQLVYPKKGEKFEGMSVAEKFIPSKCLTFEVFSRLRPKDIHFHPYNWGFSNRWARFSHDNFKTCLMYSKTLASISSWTNVKYEYPPIKLTWQWKLDKLKMYFILKMGMFHCHVVSLL